MYFKCNICNKIKNSNFQIKEQQIKNKDGSIDIKYLKICIECIPFY